PRRSISEDRVLERLQSRWPLVGLLAALLVLYYETSTRLWQAGTWWDVAWLVFVLIPAVFSLVLLLLPLRDSRGLFAVGAALATFAGLLAGLGLTIAATVYFDLRGLPALPGIAIGFLLPNADLIVRRLRGQPGLGDRPQIAVGRPADDG